MHTHMRTSFIFVCGIHRLRIEPNASCEVDVECHARFSTPVEAQLTFWALKSDRGGMSLSTNMVFTLR
jgi:hypothetical protein